MSLDSSTPSLGTGSYPVANWVARNGGASTGEDRLLRASEVQRELGVSRATAYRMMADGTLPTYRFGGCSRRRTMIRVSQKELRAWLLAHRAGTREPDKGLPADSLLTNEAMLQT
jgi:excisionase family DNA binding protein